MAEDPQFLVNPYNEPVIIQLNGKASFMNSAPLKAFFLRMIEQGKRNFVVDFEHCKGMDSTFLGILAGLGIELMKAEDSGSVVLTRLGERNLELVRNLGLHRIMTVDDGQVAAETAEQAEALELTAEQRGEVENARLVLQAHENLVEIDESNKTKFQDVISFLKNQMDEA